MLCVVDAVDVGEEVDAIDLGANFFFGAYVVEFLGFMPFDVEGDGIFYKSTC